MGAMAGAEVPIVENKLSFQGDVLLGYNDLSVAVLGGVYTFANHWQLSLGYQVPMPTSGNRHGLVSSSPTRVCRCIESGREHAAPVLLPCASCCVV